MNLWFRLRAYLFAARWRPALVLPEGVSVLRFCAWPTDLDPSVHVNNGKYLSLITSVRLTAASIAWMRPIYKGW